MTIFDDQVERRYADARRAACAAGSHCYRRGHDDVWRCVTAGCGHVAPLQPGVRVGAQ